MYLHCHACGWSQDDFWTKENNPVVNLAYLWEKEMLTSQFSESRDMFVKFKGRPGHVKEVTKKMTGKNFLIGRLAKAIQTINHMEYNTFEEFKRLNPDGICPKCGKKELDID